MRRLYLFTVLILSLAVLPQTISAQRRGRIENVSHYGSPTPISGLRRIGSQASAPIRSVGSPILPILLVQFSDKKFSVAGTDNLVNQLYDSFFNASEGIHPGQEGYTSWCSVREYFRMQSGGLFTPQFVIIGPVTLDNGYAYYGQNSRSSKDINISKFYSEACQKAAASSQYPWADFDNNNNGNVDFVFFIYAGEGENGCDDTNTIWPKESVSSLSVQTETERIVFGAYGCTNELFSGGQDGIGPIIHEMGHGLGLPDFYDTNYNAFGLDCWDIMDSGCYQLDGHQPCHMSAYELEFMNWRQLVTIAPDSATSLTLNPLEAGGTAYKLPNPSNRNEYYILENRQNIGCDRFFGCVSTEQYNKYGANHGLMVTHVDFSQSAWNNNTVNTSSSHQRITIVPADGQLVSSIPDFNSTWAKSIHGDLYPSDKNVTELTSYKTFTGSNLGLIVNNIQETNDGLITLDINGGSTPTVSGIIRAIDSYRNRTDIPIRRVTSIIERLQNAQ